MNTCFESLFKVLVLGCWFSKLNATELADLNPSRNIFDKIEFFIQKSESVKCLWTKNCQYSCFNIVMQWYHYLITFSTISTEDTEKPKRYVEKMPR